MTPAEIAALDVKKRRLRRFTWCRIHHALLDDVRWRLVARMAGAPQHLVEAFVLRLEIVASANTPRGSLDGLNIPALAAHWNLSSDEQLGRIYAALEHPEVGWIDQDTVITFYDRNPDVEDKTAAARPQRRRDRAREAKAAAKAQREGRAYPQSRVTDRDTVTVTPRSDQNIKQVMLGKEEKGASEKATNGTAIHTDSGDSGDTEIWLAMEGKRIVSERCKLLPSRAWLEISRWRKELSDDIGALAEMIADADMMGLDRGKFTDRIRDRIIAWRYQAKGPALPLPPAAVKNRDSA
jgi:hypothetical protein